MATALLITRQDIVEQTVLGGVVDTDKYLQNIKYAQDAKLRVIIGDDLLAKLETDVINSTLTGDYLTLVNSYIKNYLTYAAASDYILTAGINVTNGGVTSYSPDNGTQATREQINILSTNVENKAEHYGQTMIKYLDNNRSLFPEYKGSSTNSNFNGWQLDNGYGCNY
jgi:hypothetical protein